MFSIARLYIGIKFLEKLDDNFLREKIKIVTSKKFAVTHLMFHRKFTNIASCRRLFSTLVVAEPVKGNKISLQSLSAINAAQQLKKDVC